MRDFKIRPLKSTFTKTLKTFIYPNLRLTQVDARALLALIETFEALIGKSNRIWILYGFSISFTVSIDYYLLQLIFPERIDQFLENSQVLLLGGITLPLILLFLANWSLLFALSLKKQYREHWIERYGKVLRSSQTYLGTTISSSIGVVLSLPFYIFILGLFSLFSFDTSDSVRVASNLTLVGLFFVALFFALAIPFHLNLSDLLIKEKRKRIYRSLFLLMFPLWFGFIALFLFL